MLSGTAEISIYTEFALATLGTVILAYSIYSMARKMFNGPTTSLDTWRRMAVNDLCTLTSIDGEIIHVAIPRKLPKTLVAAKQQVGHPTALVVGPLGTLRDTKPPPPKKQYHRPSGRQGGTMGRPQRALALPPTHTHTSNSPPNAYTHGEKTPSG